MAKTIIILYRDVIILKLILSSKKVHKVKLILDQIQDIKVSEFLLILPRYFRQSVKLLLFLRLILELKDNYPCTVFLVTLQLSTIFPAEFD